MLLYSNNNNTLRLLERNSGSELRYNRHVFFANDALTKILKLVISTSTSGDMPDFLQNTWVDEVTVRLTLEKLSMAGIPLSFWGDTWTVDVITSDVRKSEKE